MEGVNFPEPATTPQDSSVAAARSTVTGRVGRDKRIGQHLGGTARVKKIVINCFAKPTSMKSCEKLGTII